MKEKVIMGMNLTRRVVTLVALFALMSSLVLTARPLRMSALAHRADASSAVATHTATTQLTAEQARAAYGKVGMSFEANRGQTNDEVKFLARGSGYTLFLTPAEAVFVMARQGGERAESRADSLLAENTTERTVEATASEPQAVLRMKLEGANSQPAVSGLNELEGKVNYFIGNDPAKWQTDVPTFGRVHYAGVYEGVDMVYYGNQQQLEYDFVVAPGADYRQIALSFEGADKLEVEAATGDLLLEVGEGVLRQQKPVVYQEVNGARQEIESGYVMKDVGRVGFAVGAYDAQRPLIIDPVLVYSTYLGGTDADEGLGIEVDSAGNAYVTGQTRSTNFPTTPGGFDTTFGGGTCVSVPCRDTFVSKLNAAGTALVYSTYLGTIDDDGSIGLAVDGSGNAYIAGFTDSTTFPTTAGAFDTTYNGGVRDAVLTKLNATGSALIYSTYLGGNLEDVARNVEVDFAGNAYVAGLTVSTDFPVANAIQGTYGGNPFDGFVTKLNPAGSALVYSTYLGGNGSEFGNSITVDSAGSAYVAGFTSSTNFPVANAIQSTYAGGAFDAFVTKLNADGSAFVYSTYLGGSGNDQGNSIAIDSAGNAYGIGRTASATDFPLANAIQGTYGGSTSDAFVTKLNAAGSAFVYSTYLGGSSTDESRGIAIDSAGNAYITGHTFSTNFPVANAIQGTNGGSSDVFVTKLNAAGSAFFYSTYLGGSGGEIGGRGSIALDSAGSAYVTGRTDSTNFPTRADAIQNANAGGFDAFVFKILDYSISGRVIDSSGNGIAGVTVTLSGTSSAVTTTDAGGNFVFLNLTPNGNYTVTPFKEGLIFSPESITINNLNSNQQLLFIGTPPPTPTPTPTPTLTPATFGFSAASFAVSEGAGSAQIIVSRTGDTASAVAVEYATTDGTANDRGDYTTAIGRLRFAGGETAKSFTVFVTDDVFAEGNETLDITLSNPSASGQVAGSGTVILTIVDNDAVTGATNPIDSTTFFVRQHYVDFLNREPDAAGLAFWTNNIESCGASAGCREAKRIDTSAAFFLSIEFQETGFLIHRVTRASFNRLPRYREFIRDTQEIGRGVVVGQAGWEAQLEANKVAFFNEFVTRSEFTAIYGGLTNEQYVDALNGNTGGSLSAAERNALVAGLNAATETRASVLRKVADDSDFKAREFNAAFVLMQYFGYLRRNPDDAPDSNFSGYNFWLDKLNSFGGDFRRAEMVKAFISSIEYRARFGQP